MGLRPHARFARRWSSANTLDNTIQKQFPLSVSIDSLVVSASQDAGGYAISRQNNLELHLGCHGTPVVRTDGRRLSVYEHVITKFSTYPWCSAGKRFARERAPL